MDTVSVDNLTEGWLHPQIMSHCVRKRHTFLTTPPSTTFKKEDSTLTDGAKSVCPPDKFETTTLARTNDHGSRRNMTLV